MSFLSSVIGKTIRSLINRKHYCFGESFLKGVKWHDDEVSGVNEDEEGDLDAEEVGGGRRVSPQGARQTG